MNSAVLSLIDPGQEADMDKPTIAQLAERVDNHIRFFWVAVAAGFAWLAVLSGFLFNMNSTIGRVERAKADEPFRIVAGILNTQSVSREEEAGTLSAVSSILRSAQIMRAKPDKQTVNNVGTQIVKAQDKYPDLLITWKATASFINYKSKALLTTAGIPKGADGRECRGTFGALGWVFDRCEINLEGLAARITGNKINGEKAAFIFTHCIVHYNGGSIPAKRLTFIDSIFQFDVNRIPDVSGTAAMRQLALSTTSQPEVTL